MAHLKKSTYVHINYDQAHEFRCFFVNVRYLSQDDVGYVVGCVMSTLLCARCQQGIIREPGVIYITIPPPGQLEIRLKINIVLCQM